MGETSQSTDSFMNADETLKKRWYHCFHDVDVKENKVNSYVILCCI